jgi:hypothetical protein
MQELGNKKWNAAIVVILKDEARFIEDWILFHLAIGFEHFVVYDNGSTDGIGEVLRKFIAGGVVTFIDWPIRAGQIDAYNHALCVFRNCSEWLCFIDVDEYVVLHDHDDVLQFLSGCGADQILLPWRNFPYGGHKSSPGGTDIENYFWAYKGRPDLAVQVKHLVKSSKALRVTAHFSVISSGTTIIADGTPSVPTHLVTGPSYRIAQINHYATRSYADNLARMRKGQVDGGAEKQLADFAPLTTEGAAHLDYDASVLRHFQKFADERERWRPISATPHRFGLMQRNPILSSWNNLLFFFGKSYANYLVGRNHIAHGTDLDLVHVDALGNEHNLRNFWHDEDLRSVSFRVDQHSFVPFFMGSIHYGDFARRFGFQASFVARDLKVDDHWSHLAYYDGRCCAAIFDMDSQGGVEIDMTFGDKSLNKFQIAAGRHAGFAYGPEYLVAKHAISLNVSGSCRVRELIIGSLP